MDFGNFACRICNGKLVPKLNELVCSNCNYIQHPIKENNFGISVQELKKKLDNKEDLVIVDVREKWEFGMANIKNSKLIPLRELKDNLKNLDKNKLTITVCHFGNDRSFNAARYLIQNGFKNIKNLEGGIDGWASKIDTSLKRY